MRYENIALAFLVLLLLGFPQAAAEAGTTIVLVSDNYADCAVAEALAEENDATIVKTTWGEFEQSVLDTIAAEAPDDVIIIGGPMAVLDDYETGLQDAGIDFNRAYGQTRQQTSLAVFNQYRNMYNWSAAVGDGTQPYRTAGKFPVWYFDDETEIDSFIQQHGAMVMNYGMSQRFAGRHGAPMMDVAPAEVQNFGLQMRDRIHMQYSNSTWIRQRVDMGPGMGMRGH
jgi:hypothetical protein